MNKIIESIKNLFSIKSKNPHTDQENFEEDEMFEPATSGDLFVTPEVLSFSRVSDWWTREIFEIEMVRFRRIQSQKSSELKKLKLSLAASEKIKDDIAWIETIIKSKQDEFFIHSEINFKEENKLAVYSIYSANTTLKNFNFVISTLWLQLQGTKLSKVKDYFAVMRNETLESFISRKLIDSMTTDNFNQASGKTGSGVVLKNKNKNKV